MSLPFFFLNLPVFGSNLESCLQKYIAPEVLENENAWLNEKTQESAEVTKISILLVYLHTKINE